MTTRRDILKQAAALTGLSVLGDFSAATPAHRSLGPLRWRFGACDWSIGQRGHVAALEQAAKIGLDGVQVSFAHSPDDVHLIRPAVQQAYLRAAEEYDVALGGLALGVLNGVPLKSSERAARWVQESVEVAEALDIDVILLAFFSDADIKDDPDGQDVVIERLRQVAPKAEAVGVVLGIESWLSAEEHLRLIEAVGSPSVQVYYDTANSARKGYDIYEEIRQLGAEHICQIHAKANGALLGQGRVDFRRVRAALEDIGYEGWIHIEGGIPPDGDLFESYVANVGFLRNVFFGGRGSPQICE